MERSVVVFDTDGERAKRTKKEFGRCASNKYQALGPSWIDAGWFIVHSWRQTMGTVPIVCPGLMPLHIFRRLAVGCDQ